MKNKALLVLSLLLVGCAKSPDAIVPVSMAGAYDGISCSKARTLLAQEQSNLAALSDQQRSAATGDAVGVFLLGVPMASVTGGDNEGQIASSKGKIDALQARLLSCG